MKQDVHERARQAIALENSEALGSEDSNRQEQSWLRSHLQECAACRQYAEAAHRVVRALHFEPVLTADFDLVRVTRMRVHARALELRRRQERIWLVSFCCLFVALSAALLNPLVWWLFRCIGLWMGASRAVWQSSFAIFWVAPTLVAGAILLARNIDFSNTVQGRWNERG